jgi:tnp2 family transposase
LINPLGLEYTKIDACPNDCVLYRKEYENSDECPICRVSRYKCKEKNSIAQKLRPPAKVLWYLPIIPRFRRLFSIPEDAKKLVWHDEERKKDGLIRHPADSMQWKNIDKEFPIFGDEARNLRLGLSTDGMNPYGTLSTQHSTWPVLLSIYNLPPWLCMKRKYILLPLLIPGPKQPGNDIDVYLAPLMDELMLLWNEGVPMFDAHTGTNFAP